MSIVQTIPTTSRLGSEVSRTSGTVGAISDTEDLRRPAVGVALTTAGALSILTPEGHTQTYASGELVVGQQYPLRIKRVLNTGTTATNAQIRLFFSRY